MEEWQLALPCFQDQHRQLCLTGRARFRFWISNKFPHMHRLVLVDRIVFFSLEDGNRRMVTNTPFLTTMAASLQDAVGHAFLVKHLRPN